MTPTQAIEEIKEEQCTYMFDCKKCLKDDCAYYLAIEALRFKDELMKRARDSRD